MDDEIAPILLILPAPDELGIKVRVARIADLLRSLLLLFQHRLELRSWNVLPLVGVVLEHLDRFGGGSLGHGYCSVCQSSGFMLESRLGDRLGGPMLRRPA